ncbi:9049_t:CDS:1, partial [Acaulospora morrowiae]
VKEQYNEWMAEEIKELTPSGRIKRPPYNLIAQWVLTAWEQIDSKLIEKSFKCCGISNSRNGSEDKLIFDYDRLILTQNRKENNDYIFENIEYNNQEKKIIDLTEINNNENNEVDKYYEKESIAYNNIWKI